jgi:hypothetical protein
MAPFRRARLRTPSLERRVVATGLDAVLAVAGLEAWRRVRGEPSLFAFHDHDDDDEAHAHDHGGEAHAHGGEAHPQDHGCEAHPQDHGDEAHAHDHRRPRATLRERLVRDAAWLVVGIAVDVGLQGRTPGRRIAGLRLARADGRDVDLATAFVREATPKVLSRSVWLLARRGPDAGLAVAGCGMGLFSSAVQLTDPQFRTLGDIVAGTLVTLD